MTIISDNCRFIFIHTPKCGGSSVKTEWQRIGRWGDIVLGATEEGEALQHVFKALYGVNKHTPATKLRDVLGSRRFARYETVAQVRCPQAIVESHYRFALAMFDGEAQRLGVSAAQLQDMARSDAEEIPCWIRQMTKGAILSAFVARDFDEWLEQVLDERWSNFIRRFTHDENGRQIVDKILKIEEPEKVNSYFNKKIRNFNQHVVLKNLLSPFSHEVIPKYDWFFLGHANRGKITPLVWSQSQLRRFIELTEGEYRAFDYEISSG